MYLLCPEMSGSDCPVDQSIFGNIIFFLCRIATKALKGARSGGGDSQGCLGRNEKLRGEGGL